MTEPDLIQRDAREVVAALPGEKIAGRTVLLTGATGIVGTYFLATLRELADGPHAPERVFAVARREVPAHLRAMFTHPRFTLLTGELHDAAFCRTLPTAGLIVHAGGYGQPGKFMENPLATLRLNTAATCDLLDRLTPGGRFLFISTSELYSGLPNPPFCEDQIGTTNTDHARACYIEAKRCGEAICHAASRGGIAARAARLALAYGPGTRADDQRVLNTFIRRALTERAIRMMDQGTAWRTYGYVADAVRMLWRILLEGREVVYNVGGDSRTTIRELAELIGRVTNVPVSFPTEAAGQALAGAPDDVRLDMGRFEREFGAIPFVPLEEGVRRTVAWQKSLYNAV